MYNKLKQMSIEKLMSSLEDAYKKSDEVKVATLFYAIGERYLKEGKEEKALVYIQRFDELVGCDDDLYTQFQDEDDQAAEWIEELQGRPSFVKEIREWVLTKDEELNEFQKMQWNLLTMARINGLFDEFSKISGFEVLGEYEMMLDTMVEGIYGGCEEEQEEMMDDFLLDLEDSMEIQAMISSKSRIKIENRADFEALDLDGDNFLTNMMLALYGIVNSLEGDEEAELTLDFVTNTLHAGYYARTCEESLYEIAALAEEKNRIIADYEFVTSNPKEEEFVARIKAYKKMFLPK